MMYLFNDIRSITVKRNKCMGKHGLINHSRSDLLSTQKLVIFKYFNATKRTKRL